MSKLAEQTVDRRVEFAGAFGRGVARFEPEDFAEGVLALPFGLSAWMRQCAVDAEEACAGIGLLREALVTVSGLHRASEPRPLMPADRRVAVLNMAVYLDTLVARASRNAGTSRAEILEAAVSHLEG